jgi:hypothetical protein
MVLTVKSGGPGAGVRDPDLASSTNLQLRHPTGGQILYFSISRMLKYKI